MHVRSAKRLRNQTIIYLGKLQYPMRELVLTQDVPFRKVFLGKCRVFVLLTPPALLTTDMAKYEKTHKFSGLKLNPSLRKLMILTIDGSGFSGLSWERSKSFQWKDDAKKKSWKKTNNNILLLKMSHHMFTIVYHVLVFDKKKKRKKCVQTLIWYYSRQKFIASHPIAQWSGLSKLLQKEKLLFWYLFVCIYVEFSKFYGKVGVIFLILFHLIWKNYILYWDFDLKSWFADFFH